MRWFWALYEDSPHPSHTAARHYATGQMRDMHPNALRRAPAPDPNNKLYIYDYERPFNAAIQAECLERGLPWPGEGERHDLPSE